jgi:chromosome segregation ATPase
MTVLRTLLLAVLAVSLPAAAGSQSLGDLAARERAKREEKARQGKATGKVYTDADLAEPGKTAENGGSGAESQPSVQAQSRYRGEYNEEEGPAPASPGERGNSEENESEETSWRQRAASARAPLTQAEGQLAQVDARIASIREQLSPVRMGGPEQDTNKILALQEEVTQAEAERGSAQNAVEEARKQWQSFLDEAKGSGVPAGWLEGSPR